MAAAPDIGTLVYDTDTGRSKSGVVVDVDENGDPLVCWFAAPQRWELGLTATITPAPQ